MMIRELVEECEALRDRLSRSFVEATRPAERFAISEALMQVIEVRRALERGVGALDRRPAVRAAERSPTVATRRLAPRRPGVEPSPGGPSPGERPPGGPSPIPEGPTFSGSGSPW